LGGFKNPKGALLRTRVRGAKGFNPFDCQKQGDPSFGITRLKVGGLPKARVTHLGNRAGLKLARHGFKSFRWPKNLGAYILLSCPSFQNKGARLCTKRYCSGFPFLTQEPFFHTGPLFSLIKGAHNFRFVRIGMGHPLRWCAPLSLLDP